MALEYTYVINPTGQIDNHILREMFEDIKVFADGLPASGGGAPEGASYVTLGTNTTLTAERVLTAGTAIGLTDNGAGSTVVVNNTGVTSITGTANQVIASGATGAVTLSLPQSIATSSNVEFNRLNLSVGSAASPSLYFDAVGSGNVVFGIWAEASGAGGFLDFSGGGITFAQFTNALCAFSSNLSTTGSITAATGAFSTAVTLEETGGGTDTITIQAPSSIAAPYTLTLPDTNGDANQLLTTDGDGVLSWTSPAGAGANAALSNLASVAINTTLVSDTNNTDDLGTSSIAWKDLFLTGSIKNGSSTCITVSTAGEVTQPLQPCFLVGATGGANVTGDGTVYTVAFNTEIIDRGGDFASNTFTSPVSGDYYLSATIDADQLSTANHTECEMNIVTSNRSYTYKFSDIPTSLTRTQFGFSVIADMDANDTATVTFKVDGVSKVVDVSANVNLTRFSGSLIN